MDRLRHLNRYLHLKKELEALYRAREDFDGTSADWHTLQKSLEDGETELAYLELHLGLC